MKIKESMNQEIQECDTPDPEYDVERRIDALREELERISHKIAALRAEIEGPF